MKILLCITRSVLVSLFLCHSALAHNTLKESNPANQAVLAKPPEKLVLAFSDPTYLEGVKITSMLDGKEMEVELESSTQAARQFSVPMPALTSGEYRVNWLVIGDDTHEIRGEFRFTVIASDR